ncbi:FtsK/SpoIIIE domain-containing protein [Vibrio hippocampi]|uniref:FtsK domain-containing protein n=1 Tax=Vibrio hippocampi TaxID=654686 RepID=A0ABN8DE13_9VIBR|nr:FtsK/SpoIIIE domain-containing protein [Vibrio hippocampi]CAH0524890.1 hypothetical protein VHP8226_00565 [Vibrio hippocampi]
MLAEEKQYKALEKERKQFASEIAKVSSKLTEKRAALTDFIKNTMLPGIAEREQSSQQELQPRVDNVIAHAQQQLIARIPAPLQPILDQVDWTQYDFSGTFLPKRLVVGAAPYEYDFLRFGKLELNAPIHIPFLDSDYSYTIDQSEHSIDMINALVFRFAVMLPYSSQFTLLDPAKLGQSFPYTKRLPSKRVLEHDVSRVLEEILSDIVRIQNSYLDNNIQRLTDVSEDILGNTKFELIIAKDFPQAYDRRSIELLAKIANTGPKAGKMLVLEQDRQAELPAGLSANELFPNLQSLQKQKGLPRERFDCDNQFDDSVSDKTIDHILDGLARAKPKETKLGISDVIVTDPEQWWQESATELIAAPIGGSGSKKNDINLWFGEKNKQPSSHGMLAAMTGAGKSNLYHAFILSLATRYSPDDLQFYLIDGKQGVEFQSYPELPHARVVSLNTSPQLARSVLEELLEEMNRRNDMFKELGFADFIRYRKAGSPNGKLPRLMLIIDEYQTLFEDDKTGFGSQLMIAIASQSRSAGIHMFVGSQKFVVPGMSQPQAIFSNINLRVAMKMSGEEVTSLQEFGSKGKQLIRGCTETGQVVVSHSGGADEVPCDAGRVAYIDDEQRSQMLASLNEKAQAASGQEYKTILLDGAEQPQLINNEQLRRLTSDFGSKPNDKARKEHANQSQHLGGLEESEWYPIEKPTVFWLGKEMNIHGYAKFILRRRAHEHLLLVGDSTEARIGMLAYMIGQLSITVSEQAFELHILERTIKGSQWHGVLEQANNSLGERKGTISETYAEFEQQLAHVMQELQQRQEMDEEEMMNLPSIFVVINDAQRVKELAKKENSYGMRNHDDEGGQIINTLLEVGSEYGIHLLLNFDSVLSVTKAFDRNDIDQFRHKVALQMSEEDSFRLLKSRDAAKLQMDGKKPIYALYTDQMQNRPNKFMPYCHTDEAELERNLSYLSQACDAWSE